MPSFDWYQATIPAHVDDVLECLSDLAPGLRPGYRKGMHGFELSTVLTSDEEGDVATVWSGGTHEYPHAVLSGWWAAPGAGSLRASFPVHNVSRLDVKEDYFEADAYERIQASGLLVADAHRVKVGTAGDHLLTKEGRTFYMGSRKSVAFNRLYDKRTELLSKLPPGHQFVLERGGPLKLGGLEMASFPDHWTRLESQLMPATREAKARFASIEPVEALGSTAWLRALWQAVEGLELEPVQIGRGYRVADEQRARAWFLRNSKNVLLGYLHDSGSAECAGLQIFDELKEMMEADRLRKSRR